MRLPDRTRRAPFVVTVASLLLACSGCITNPKAEALRQQQMIEVGDALNDIRITMAGMAEQLDSMRTVLAKQDTTLARLANVTGVIVVK